MLTKIVLGMLLGLARSWPSRLIGLVLGFGPARSSVRSASSSSKRAWTSAGAPAVGIGLAAGALVYFVLARPSA